MKTEEQIQAEFKEHVRNRRDGFEAAQERIRNEICAARRRKRLVLIPRPLRAAAALLKKQKARPKIIGRVEKGTGQSRLI